MDRNRIMSLANKCTKNSKPGGVFASSGPSERWMEGFFDRMKLKFPDTKLAYIRNTTSGFQDTYNSENINWWYDNVKNYVISQGFARYPTADDETDSELIWTTPERVIITDETGISGDTRKKGKSTQKFVTSSLLIEETSDLRRLQNQTSETKEHITLVGGHNLKGHATLPVYIICSEKEISENVKSKVCSAIPNCTCRDSTTVGNDNKKFVTWSKKGSMTRANIEIMIDMIKHAYPDVKDEDTKRVLWMTDSHPSRYDLGFLERLREIGIVLCCWLPNCTSVMQSPDVVLFGPFKKKYTKMKKEWEDARPGKVIGRDAKITCATNAYYETFTLVNCVKGAMRTGIDPFTRKMHLVSRACEQADLLSTQNRGGEYTKLIYDFAESLQIDWKLLNESDCIHKALQDPKILEQFNDLIEKIKALPNRSFRQFGDNGQICEASALSVGLNETGRYNRILGKILKDRKDRLMELDRAIAKAESDKRDYLKWSETLKRVNFIEEICIVNACDEEASKLINEARCLCVRDKYGLPAENDIAFVGSMVSSGDTGKSSFDIAPILESVASSNAKKDGVKKRKRENANAIGVTMRCSDSAFPSSSPFRKRLREIKENKENSRPSTISKSGIPKESLTETISLIGCDKNFITILNSMKSILQSTSRTSGRTASVREVLKSFKERCSDHEYLSEQREAQDIMLLKNKELLNRANDFFSRMVKKFSI